MAGSAIRTANFRYTLGVLVIVAACVAHWAAAAEPPTAVSFLSADGRTNLYAYLFKPATPPPWPAVVMLHGRSGPYSSAAKGVFDATTLSQRHLQWGWFWASRGYLALHVDSFGSRGYAGGFPIRSYSTRPPEVNEQTVRPLDAYGALAWLRSRNDVIADRIGLQGWSNGAMAGLAAMGALPHSGAVPPEKGFRAALLFYPGCRIQVKQDYRPYAPVLMFVAAADEEVAPLPCRQLAEQIKGRGIDQFDIVWYAGATHAFDDPGKRRQSVDANRAARSDAMLRAAEFFDRNLRH